MGQTRKVSGWTIAAAGLALFVLVVIFVGWRASRALHISTEEVRSEREIRFSVKRLSTPAEQSFEVVSAPAVFLEAALFQDRLYIAGPAGLLEYDSSGTLLRQYAVGRDLPSSPLVAIAPAVLADSGEPELVVATSQDGLLAFNSRGFRQIFPQDAHARAITSVLPVAAGHILIGTKKRGVLLYDGKQITTLHPTLSNLYVTALAGSESDLWVGTLNQGVLRWHAGASEQFGEKQGLPDPQVQSIAISGDKTYIGTVLGVAVFERGRFSRIQAVYALTRNGLYRMSVRGFGWQPVLQPDPAVLSDHNISALAADSSGRVWVGYFDRGLDLLQPDSRRVTHVENEHVFCVNRILPDARTGTVAVATANGLVRFDAAGSQEQVLTRADGLIADHVTDVVPYQDGLAVATPAGLTFLDAGGARSMYAFHGLVNNHVYALGVSGDELMAGTLGGLSVIGKGDVQVNYTAASSGLKHNWITAVVPVGAEWMVGTYGAGILGLDRSGHFHPFEKATGQFEVNPNAMLVTSRHVFAGTLGNGLYVYDREWGRWSEITQGLPSSNVTALAESNGYLYVGTDNGLVRIPEQKLHP